MANPFDQFDAPVAGATPGAPPLARPAAGANPFDQFDGTKPAPDSPTVPPVPDAGLAPEPKPLQTSMLGAAARSAGTSVVPSLGAWGGAEGGAALGAEIGSIFPGPGTAIGGVLGGFVGAIAGSIGADKAQRAALKTVDPGALDELDRYQPSDAAQHPVAQFAGDLAGGASVFKLAPLTAARGAAALLKGSRLGMDVLTPAERRMAQVFVTQAGMGTAAGVVSPLLSGQRPTLGGVASAAAQGMMFGEPRFGHPVEAPTEPAAPPQTKAQETLAKGTAKVKDILAPPAGPDLAGQETASTPPADYRYTVQRDQPDGKGGTIPGYVQIDGPGADGKNESSNLDELRARGINLPDVPDHLPQGQYSLDQINEASKVPPQGSSDGLERQAHNLEVAGSNPAPATKPYEAAPPLADLRSHPDLAPAALKGKDVTITVNGEEQSGLDAKRTVDMLAKRESLYRSLLDCLGA